ncbi:MAG: dipicolinate synthase subunit DpsA [Butyricicoccus sp.]
MNQSTTLAVVGGDVRQAYLAELLHEAGHTVRTFALERRPARLHRCQRPGVP